MALTPIGDIGTAGLTDNTTVGTTLTWSTFSDWVNGTNDLTQGYDAAFGDFPTDDLSILIVNGNPTIQSFGGGANCTGVAHDPDGDGGNGSIINPSDGDTAVYIRDQSGNVLSSFNTNASGPKGCGFFPSRDGGNGSIWVVNDTESNNLNEYDKNGNTLNQYNPAGNLFGCATDDQYVYVSDGGSVYQVDPSDGSVVTSWSHSISPPPGLGYSGHYLLLTDPGNGDLYVYDKNDGTELFGPAGMSESSGGEGKGGDTIFAYGSLWFAERAGDQIHELTVGYPSASTTQHTTTTKSN